MYIFSVGHYTLTTLTSQSHASRAGAVTRLTPPVAAPPLVGFLYGWENADDEQISHTEPYHHQRRGNPHSSTRRPNTNYTGYLPQCACLCVAHLLVTTRTHHSSLSSSHTLATHAPHMISLLPGSSTEKPKGRVPSRWPDEVVHLLSRKEHGSGGNSLGMTTASGT